MRLGKPIAWGTSKTTGMMTGPFGKGMIAGSAALGSAHALLDRSGPYPDIQEYHFGDPEAFRTFAKATISNVMRDTEEDAYGDNEFLYNRPVSRRSSGGGRGSVPVDGSIVLGLYNKRLG